MNPPSDKLQIAQFAEALTSGTARYETQAELDHRLSEAAKDAEEKRHSARTRRRLFVGTYVAVLALSVYLTLWGEPQQSAMAFDLIKQIGVGTAGYFIGKKRDE